MNAAEFSRKRERIEREPGRQAAWRKRALRRLISEANAQPITADHHVVGYFLPSTSQSVCVKRRYGLEADALVALAGITATGGQHMKPSRVYACPHCRGWHLTSQEKII